MRLLLSVSIMLFALNTFAGGPWVKEKNNGILINSISTVIYKTMSSSTGSGINLPRRVSDISQQNYLEFGITNSLTMIANLELKYVGTSSKVFTTSDFNTVLPNDKLFGIGNSSIGFKYGITKSKFLFSISYTTEFPNAGSNNVSGLRTGAPTWGFVPGVHLGQGFSKGVYYYVEGYFVARNKWSHEWRVNAEVGYTFKRPLTMALFLSSKQSLGNKATNDDPNYIHTGLFLNNQEFIAWNFKFMHDINDKMGIMTSLAGGFTTRLIARTPVISGGFYFQWDKQTVIAN